MSDPRERGHTADRTADGVMLDALAYEFASDDAAETGRKIERRLRAYGLGPYQQERVDLLRRLKNDVQDELHRRSESAYFAGSHGTFSALEDFDTRRLTRDVARSYPTVPRAEVERFIPFAVYLYYLR